MVILVERYFRLVLLFVLMFRPPIALSHFPCKMRAPISVKDDLSLLLLGRSVLRTRLQSCSDHGEASLQLTAGVRPSGELQMPHEYVGFVWLSRWCKERNAA